MVGKSLRGVVLAASLTLLGPARADTAAVETSIAASLQWLQNAATELAADHRTDAGVDVGFAQAEADAALAAVGAQDALAELGDGAARASAAVHAFQAKVAKALKQVDSFTAQPFSAAKAVAVAAKEGQKAVSALRRVPATGFLVEELKFGSAGFHTPADTFLMRISPGTDGAGGACGEVPVILIVDTSNAGAILPPGPVIAPFGPIDPALLSTDANGNYLLPVTMGPVGGAGRIEVTACGQTRRWLLFNYGPRGSFPKLRKPTFSTFDGHYVGQFEGVIHRDGLNGGSNELYADDVVCDFAAGRITVTEPFDGAGTVSSTGRISGTGDFQGATVRFSGTARFVKGKMVATGSYSFSVPGVRGHGTFRFGR